MKTSARTAAMPVLAMAALVIAGCGKPTSAPADANQAEPPNPAEANAANTPYPDPLLTAVANKESVAKAQELDAYNLGVMAYLWGYPLVRMERVMREYTDVTGEQPATSYRAPLNRIGWATALATPDAKDMPTANNDTLYMSAVVQLTEPFVLEVPDTQDRYYVINVFSTYHVDEKDIGRRTTGTKAGRFALVPPGWEGSVPAGVQRVDVSTDKVWLWGRLRVLDGEDTGELQDLLAKFTLRPLSQAGNAGYVAPEAKLPSLPDIAGDDLGFFVHLGHAMTQNPVPEVEKALVGQFERIGLTDKGFDRGKLTPAQIESLKRALQDGTTVASTAITNTSTQRSGWNWAPLEGYGWNYPLRAVHSGPYLGGNVASEALYPNTVVDADGNVLTGANRYELRFTEAPPVDAFWSLTIYNAEDKMLVANPLGRYKIGSDTAGLKIDPDGSFAILIQHDTPADASNWLPAPEGNFNLFLRFYQPRQELLDGTSPLPELVKLP